MARKSKHLTYQERIQIQTLRKENFSHNAIARHIGRDRRTVDREIKRNSTKHGYQPRVAGQLYRRRRRRSQYKKVNKKMLSYIEKKLKLQHSPDQIANTMQRNIGCKISTKRIYQLIWKNKKNGGILYQNLRIQNGKKIRKKRGSRAYRQEIPHRIDIDQRPEEVNNRSEYGHWEADLVLGKKSTGGALVTLLERKSRLLLIGHVTRKTTNAVNSEIKRLLRSSGHMVKTITYDNGAEFKKHFQINKYFNCQSYFAKPYHAWERGANENANGLIRQYIPKGPDMQQVTRNELRIIMNRINNRPRKILDYETANQVWLKAV